jgi:nicotinate-nucleotide--dimethylbenzimidazole phosphoribosyltransferase
MTDKTAEQSLERLIAQIGALDEEAMAAAQQRLDSLTKPPGSLGRLESLAVQLAGITGKARPAVDRKVIVVMAADHGIVAEGVSAYPQAVTAQMVANFLRGGAAINVLARQVGARVIVADLGVAAELQDHSSLRRHKVMAGTANFARQPAMSRSQTLAALLSGAAMVQAEMENGLDILGAGDMGIGNTTASAAIAAALTGHDPAEIAGRGTGLDEAGVAHKTEIIRQALALHRPDPRDALDVLGKVGGLEIGGLAGAMLAAAAQRRPVMVDGFVSTAAAMIAVRLAPQIHPYLIAAHRSAERGHVHMLAWLKLTPLLDLEMRLGEGTGAALGMVLAEAACRLLQEMATFADAGVSERVGKND